jgi:hypothetical protein
MATALVTDLFQGLTEDGQRAFLATVIMGVIYTSGTAQKDAIIRFLRDASNRDAETAKALDRMIDKIEDSKKTNLP